MNVALSIHIDGVLAGTLRGSTGLSMMFVKAELPLSTLSGHSAATVYRRCNLVYCYCNTL
jgi:hypothetical protein